ncbi:MAG: hypothetical protein ACP5DC_10005 [Halothiobacillaceae bacterium]
MDASMLYALRDPMGVPSHPILFLVLGVLTWALHIAAVHVMLGSSSLAIWGSFGTDAHRRRLAAAMLMTAKVAISVAIVLGVAPLLFVQVIYDPFWYTSNVLSAWWAIGFIVILMVATLLLFVYYARNPKLAEGAKASCPGSMILSVVLMLAVGFIMHVLSVQMLSPDQWMEWYAPNGQLDASGTGLHDYNLWRFGFFIALSAPVTGAWLMAYRRYLSVREGEDQAYLAWVGGLAQKLAIVGGVVSLVFLALWMATLPEAIAGFAFSPWVIASVLMLLVTVFLPNILGRRMEQGLWGYSVLAVGTVALIVVAAMREAVRWTVLYGQFDYNPLDYLVNMDWYSTLLFFATFGIMGGIVVGYLLTVAWKAGQTRGMYTPSPAIDRLGTLAIASLAIWMLQYFGFGIYTMMIQ